MLPIRYYSREERFLPSQHTKTHFGLLPGRNSLLLIKEKGSNLGAEGILVGINEAVEETETVGSVHGAGTMLSRLGGKVREVGKITRKKSLR